MFSHPPKSYAELRIWQVFVSTTENEVWQVVRRWIILYGNPFIIPEEETYEQCEARGLYQEALRLTYQR